MVCHIDFIVIPGTILRSGNKIPIVKLGISLNRRSLNWGSAPYITFAGETNLYRYTGNIVKPKIVIPHIVKPGFHCIVQKDELSVCVCVCVCVCTWGER